MLRHGCRMRRRGFTMIEILVVMAIIGLLMAVLITRGGFFTAGRKTKTHAVVNQLKLMIEEYNRVKGEYPPSTLFHLDLKADNDVNEGIEACVAALLDAKYQGTLHPDEKDLKNVDNDSADRDFSVLENKRALFEVVDSEENPIVYINSTDYGKTFTYLMHDPKTHEWEPRTITAHKSKKTGGYSNHDSYQIWSAGVNGEFNTDDDVANFDLEED